MKRLLSALLAGGVLCAMLASCGGTTGQSSGNGVSVVFIPKVTGNAFFEAANLGAQAFARKYGYTVYYEGSARAAVEDQIEIVEQAIQDKVDAICISALDATALDEVLKTAMKAGIQVVTWDSDVSGDARSLMVSQGTPDQLGKMLVEMGAKSLAERGKSLANVKITYAWHYSQSTVTDQNSWWEAGEAYIRNTYPYWENVAPDNYYSEQDPDKAVQVGLQILVEHPTIDLIICNDSTSLPGQAEAAKQLGLSARNVTITGFASPNAMRAYCEEGIVNRWGLWDCQEQGALGCYLAYQLAIGTKLAVGDKVDVPDMGIITVMPNSVLDAAAYTASDSGVVLLPNRTEYTIDNVNDYDF